jgi:hypothetical protein
MDWMVEMRHQNAAMDSNGVWHVVYCEFGISTKCSSCDYTTMCDRRKEMEMKGIDEIVTKYQNVPRFHVLVNILLLELKEGIYTIADLKNAVTMSIHRYESTIPAEPAGKDRNEPQRR